MIDLVKKVLLTGVGVAALSKEKIEELAKDLAEKGKMTEKEGKTLVSQLMESSCEAREELQKQVETKVQGVLEKMDLAKKSELDALKLEIEALKKMSVHADTEE
jgi:polyhydroxyalkanoate synthesis regulator phasin